MMTIPISQLAWQTELERGVQMLQAARLVDSAIPKLARPRWDLSRRTA